MAQPFPSDYLIDIRLGEPPPPVPPKRAAYEVRLSRSYKMRWSNRDAGNRLYWTINGKVTINRGREEEYSLVPPGTSTYDSKGRYIKKTLSGVSLTHDSDGIAFAAFRIVQGQPERLWLFREAIDMVFLDEMKRRYQEKPEKHPEYHNMWWEFLQPEEFVMTTGRDVVEWYAAILPRIACLFKTR